MTFTEAALEVLRSAGEPLHYKKITELAIERNLLSHVGKTPEVTMSSRLAMMVKKDRGQAPIIKVKPGVFAIRESALQGQSLSPAALAAISEIEGLEESAAASDVTVSEDVAKVAKAAPALPGADVFPEEEGDDDPILAGLEQETDTSERAGRRRRRRRRRGKGEKAEAQADVSVRPEAAQPTRQREAFRDRPRHERERDRDRHERDGRGRADEERVRGEERARVEESVRAEEAVDWNRQPGEGDLLGKDLADAVWHVLSRGERTPHNFGRVAELLVRRGRLSGNAAALAPTIAAAVRADIARAELSRSRPRFRLRGGRLSLAEWLLPKSLARAEQDLLAGAERYAAELRRALIQKLSELPTAGFAELLATWLNAEGVTALRAVRRPGSSGSELHFAGTRKSGSEEVRLAIVVQRSGRDIDREAVIDVRGALHHYGQAQSAWLVTLGRITSGAREEAAAQAAACALFDGNALASAMERLGVAMRRHVIQHHEIDYDLLESLGDSPEQRERREREEERERKQLAERMAERQANERARATAAAQAAEGRGGRPVSEAEESRPVAARGEWTESKIDEQGELEDTDLPSALGIKSTIDQIPSGIPDQDDQDEEDALAVVTDSEEQLDERDIPAFDEDEDHLEEHHEDEDEEDDDVNVELESDDYESREEDEDEGDLTSEEDASEDDSDHDVDDEHGDDDEDDEDEDADDESEDDDADDEDHADSKRKLRDRS